MKIDSEITAQDMVNGLIRIIGLDLLSFACRVADDRQTVLWSTGETQPTADQRKRLEAIYLKLMPVCTDIGPEAAFIWFRGDGRKPSPAEEIYLCDFGDNPIPPSSPKTKTKWWWW